MSCLQLNKDKDSDGEQQTEMAVPSGGWGEAPTHFPPSRQNSDQRVGMLGPNCRPVTVCPVSVSAPHGHLAQSSLYKPLPPRGAPSSDMKEHEGTRKNQYVLSPWQVARTQAWRHEAY